MPRTQAGDGYTIYQKYEMGLNPNTFYTPLAPQNVTVTYNSTTGTATITWLPSPGNVTGYTITDAEGNTYNVTGDSFTETIPYAPDYDLGSSGTPTMQNSFQVQAGLFRRQFGPRVTPLPLQPSTVTGSIIPVSGRRKPSGCCQHSDQRRKHQGIHILRWRISRL